MLTGCTVGTNRSQHTCQQIELIRNKRIDFREIPVICIQLFLYTVIEYDQVLDDRCFLLIQQAESLRSCIGLVQDSFLDDGIHVRGRKGKPCVKASLNLGEVVTLHFGDGVDILLAGYDNPCLALAFFSQFFRYRLKVQHQLGIITDVLANLIYQEYNVMIIALSVNV